MRYHIWKIVTLVNHKKYIAQVSQTIYSTSMQLSKNKNLEEVMNIMVVGTIFNLFPVDYLKELITPKIDALLKHPMEHG